LPRLQQLALRLIARGWRLSVMGGALRIIIMPHINETTILDFMHDLKELVRE